MADLTGPGIRLGLPRGWEGEVDHGGFQPVADGSIRPTVVHLANFPLPPGRGDYGSGAVETMQAGDVLVVLYEFDQSSAGSALFGLRGVPRTVTADEFDPAALQWGRPGMSGLQRFFTERGRAFCLYIVLGSHLDRRDVLPDIEAVLAGVDIS